MATTPYLDVSGFTAATTMPPADVAALESARPGFLLARLVYRTSAINARLAKRYATPFEPPPEIVLLWLVDLVTLDAYVARGYNPGSAEDGLIKDRYDIAEAQLKEAADAKDGLFDLPLRGDAAASAISRGAPLMYTEASPFVSADLQEQQGRAEDERHAGTYGGSQ